MKPLHPSIKSGALRGIAPGDKVSFRLVNNEHCSGVIASVSPAKDAFVFAGRGFRIHAVEIAAIESHISAKAR